VRPTCGAYPIRPPPVRFAPRSWGGSIALPPRHLGFPPVGCRGVRDHTAAASKCNRSEAALLIFHRQLAESATACPDCEHGARGRKHRNIPRFPTHRAPANERETATEIYAAETQSEACELETPWRQKSMSPRNNWM